MAKTATQHPLGSNEAVWNLAAVAVAIVEVVGGMKIQKRKQQ